MAASPPEEKKRGSKTGLIAGTATAALGASLLPGAIPMLKIQGRKGLASLGVKSAAHNAHGKFVADYIDAAQGALNTGPTGRAAGRLLRHAKDNPAGRVSKGLGGPFQVEHDARFRAGHLTALNHWHWEVSEHLASKAAKGEMTQDAVSKGLARLHAGKARVDAEIGAKLGSGFNEREALRHVAASSADPAVHRYFRTLATQKAGAAQGYAKGALYAPALTLGGVAAAIGTRPREQKSPMKKFTILDGCITMLGRREDALDTIRENSHAGRNRGAGFGALAGVGASVAASMRTGIQLPAGKAALAVLAPAAVGAGIGALIGRRGDQQKRADAFQTLRSTPASPRATHASAPRKRMISTPSRAPEPEPGHGRRNALIAGSVVGGAAIGAAALKLRKLTARLDAMVTELGNLPAAPRLHLHPRVQESNRILSKMLNAADAGTPAKTDEIVAHYAKHKALCKSLRKEGWMSAGTAGVVELDSRPRTAEGTFAGGETAGDPLAMAAAYGHPAERPAAMKAAVPSPMELLRKKKLRK